MTGTLKYSAQLWIPTTNNNDNDNDTNHNNKKYVNN